jgi:hypothetical protein
MRQVFQAALTGIAMNAQQLLQRVKEERRDIYQSRRDSEAQTGMLLALRPSSGLCLEW